MLKKNVSFWHLLLRCIEERVLLNKIFLNFFVDLYLNLMKRYRLWQGQVNVVHPLNFNSIWTFSETSPRPPDYMPTKSQIILSIIILGLFCFNMARCSICHHMDGILLNIFFVCFYLANTLWPITSNDVDTAR